MRRRRAWAEAILAVLALVTAIATALFPTWFEALFEASPDSGSGALEWSVAIALFVAFAALSLSARRDFRLSRSPLSDAG